MIFVFILKEEWYGSNMSIDQIVGKKTEVQGDEMERMGSTRMEEQELTEDMIKN